MQRKQLTFGANLFIISTAIRAEVPVSRGKIISVLIEGLNGVWRAPGAEEDLPMESDNG
jgi:hypothetical protein